MAVETELKLQLEPAALNRLRRHPAILAARKGRPVSRLQKSVYFDTPDLALRDRQVILRVRHIGQRRVQTVKTMGESLGGVWARQEWEWVIEGDNPSLDPMLGSEPESLLAADGLFESLAPVFSTEVRRTIVRLAGEAEDGQPWEIEMALDEGRLVSPQGEAPIVEAELELVSGRPQLLFDLALMLQKDIPARLSVISKAEQGYHLVSGSQPQPSKAASLLLTPEMNSGEAFRVIARSCASQLLLNQDCLVETHDPEAVHQMRVALRRLRSGMNLFRDCLAGPQTELIIAELRWLQGFLSPARDTDVFIGEILSPLAGPLNDEPGYRRLTQEFADRRQAAYDTAMGVLSTPRFTRLMLMLGRWCEGGEWLDSTDETRRLLLNRPVRALADEVLENRDQKVRKGMRRFSRLSAEARHEMRIKVKKLRYCVEFFASLYNEKRVKRHAVALAALQDRLGMMNDIAVARGLLLSSGEDLGDREALWTAGQVLGWHLARIPDLLAKVRSDWRVYEKLTRYWGSPEADGGKTR